MEQEIIPSTISVWTRLANITRGDMKKIYFQMDFWFMLQVKGLKVLWVGGQASISAP